MHDHDHRCDNHHIRGTYGPALAAGNPFPGQTTPIKNFFRCGDSTNPGIGVPAVAASGAMAANAIIGVKDHWNLLDRIRMPATVGTTTGITTTTTATSSTRNSA